MTTERISGAALLLLGLFVVWENRLLPLGDHSRPGPGYLPLLLAVLLAGLGGILILRGGSAPAFRAVSWKELPHAAAILGCTLFATLFLETLGYRLTMLGILGALFGLLERLPPWLAVALTLGLSLGTFWLFDSLLRVPLPRGPWGL